MSPLIFFSQLYYLIFLVPCPSLWGHFLFTNRHLKIVASCGVHYLYGMPGLLGGIIAIFVVPVIAQAQVIGILFTVVLAVLTGAIAGLIIK